MLREPGYPFFLALIQMVSSHAMLVYVIQAFLYVAVVLLVGDTLRRLDTKIGIWGFWAAALSYGLAIYTARYMTEMLVAFLLALIGWCYVRVVQEGRASSWRYLLCFLCGALLLTRMNFLLVPLFLFFGIAIETYQKEHSWRKATASFFLSLGIVLLCVSPWVVRNVHLFQQWNIAGRSGIQLYARAVKAQKPWSSLEATYASLLIGRSTIVHFFPSVHALSSLEPWKEVWKASNEGLETGLSSAQVDKSLRQDALKIMTLNTGNLTKFFLWTGVEELRLFALPSPLAPAFGIESIFISQAETHTITIGDWFFIVVAHALQFLWWILIAVSTWMGFHRYGRAYVPGIVFLAVALLHMPVDAIMRYAVPIHPWLLGGIALTFLPWIAFWREKYRSRRC